MWLLHIFEVILCSLEGISVESNWFKYCNKPDACYPATIRTCVLKVKLEVNGKVLVKVKSLEQEFNIVVL